MIVAAEEQQAIPPIAIAAQLSFDKHDAPSTSSQQFVRCRDVLEA